jgi:hypothetical protein
MPDPKVVKRGSVANIINNLHKLEYESGRLDHPTAPKPRNTLTSDHPAQKPRGDRPVPFHERPVLRHYTPEPSEGVHGNHTFNPPGLRHHESSAEREKEEKANPFLRRDSTASSIAPTSPPQRRESISHRAFERVRATSPPLAMPVPRVEISPWHESAEQYITRKLTERWSPPHFEPRVQRGRVEMEHIDAPLVQEVLGYIDRILVEHTGTLRSVVEESRRALREKEVLCLDERHVPNGLGEDDWQSYTSSVPELIEVVDRTAQTYQRHRESDDVHTFASAKPSSHNLHANPSHEEYEYGLMPLSEVSHYSHSSRPSQTSHCSDSPRRQSQPHLPSNSHSLHLREDKPIPHHHHSFSYLPNNHAGSHESLSYNPHPHISPPPSPAFVEYDRFAALADRASRNSITNIFNTAAIHGERTESMTAEAGSSGMQTRRESHAAPAPRVEDGRKASVAGEEKGKRRVGDAWMQRSAEPAMQGKLKRESTMDRLQSSGSYESRVEKRVKVPDPFPVPEEKEIKPIAKTGKRATERMMASIMTRQGREKEGSSSAGRKI